MNKLTALIAVAGFVALIHGCATVPTTVIPAGSSIMFQTDGDAADFRAATLIDPTHIGRVVKLDRPLTVTP